jgi:membrane-bound ClpP family serine protease
MGANPKQALGLLLFLVGFVLISAGLLAGGNVVLFLAGLVVAAAGLAVLLKAKPLEFLEG